MFQVFSVLVGAKLSQQVSVMCCRGGLWCNWITNLWKPRFEGNLMYSHLCLAHCGAAEKWEEKCCIKECLRQRFDWFSAWKDVLATLLGFVLDCYLSCVNERWKMQWHVYPTGDWQSIKCVQQPAVHYINVFSGWWLCSFQRNLGTR